MALGADWEILADLRIDAPPDRITADYLLLHAEYGIALLKFGAPRIADTVDVAAAERFRRFLRERGFEIFFPGYLPIVRLSIGVQEAPFAGRLVAEAFACVPRLTVTDPAWAEAIGTVLTSTAPDGPVAEPAQQAPPGEPPISREAAAEPVGPAAIMPDKPAAETAADTRPGESPLSREPGAPAIGGLTAIDKAATETVEGDVQPGEPSTPLDPSVRDPLELTAIAPDAAAVEAVAGDAPQDEPPMSFGRGLGLADGAVSRWIERPRRSAALRVLFHRLRRGLVGHEAAAETVEDVRQRESSVSLEPPPRDSAGPASTGVEIPMAELAADVQRGEPISFEPPVRESTEPPPIRFDEPVTEMLADAQPGEPSLSLDMSAPEPALPISTGPGEAIAEPSEDARRREPSTSLDPSTSVGGPFELTAIAPDAAAVEAVTGDAPRDEPPMSFGRGLDQADGASSRSIERPRRSAALRVLFHRFRRGLVGHEVTAETVEDVRQRESSVSLEPSTRDSAEPASTGIEAPTAGLAADVQRDEPILFEPPMRESTEPPPIQFDEPVSEMLADAPRGEPSLSLDMSAPEPAGSISTGPISTGPGEATAEPSEDARQREPSTSLDPSASVGGSFEPTVIASDAVAAEAVAGDAPRDEPPMSLGRGLDQADEASSRSIERPRRSAALRVLFHRLRRGLVGHEVAAETVEDVRQRESSASLEPSTRDSAGPASIGIEAPVAGLAADVQRGEPISLEPPVRESTEPPPIRFDEPVSEMLADAPRGEPSLSLDMSAPEPAGSISTGPISTGPGEVTAEPSEDARQREPSMSLDPTASVGGRFEPTVIAPDAVAAEAVAGDAPRDEPPMSLGRGLDQADEASSRSIERPRRSAALGVLFHRLRRGLVGHEATAETVEGARRDEPPMLRDPSVSVRDPVEFELTPTETAEQAAETVAAARRREPPMPLDPSASVRDLFELTPMETAAPATETTEDVRWVEPILLHPLVRHAGDLTPARFGAPTAHRMADTRRRAPLMLFDLPALDHAGNIAPKVTWLLPEAVSRGELSASFYSEAHGVPSIGEPTVDDVWIPGASVEVRLDMALQADRALRIARAPSPRRWRPGSRLLACIMLAVGVVSLWFAPTDRPTGLLTVPPRGNPPPAGPVKQPPESNATGLAPERPPTAMARSDRRAETPRHIRPGASSRTHAVYAGRSRSLDGWPLPPSKD